MSRLSRNFHKFLFHTVLTCLVTSVVCATGSGSTPAGVKTETGDPQQNSDSTLFKLESAMTSISKEELNLRRAKWDKLKPAKYSYTLTITGFTPDRGRYFITCSGSAECEVTDTTGNVVSGKSIPTIGDLFDRIGSLIGDRRVEYTLQFDPEYGFPSHLTMKWGESAGYTISGFYLISD